MAAKIYTFTAPSGKTYTRKSVRPIAAVRIIDLSGTDCHGEEMATWHGTFELANRPHADLSWAPFTAHAL